VQLNNLQASPIVAWAREARRPTQWWLAYVYGIVVCIIIAGAIVSGIASSIGFNLGTSLGGQVVEGFTFLGTFLALAAWVRFKEGRPVSSLGFRGTGVLQRFAVGLGIGAGLLTLTVLILLALGQYTVVPPSPGSTVGWAALVPTLLLAIIWTVQSSTEETIMRGYFIQVGALQLPGWVAFVVPALVFSGLHLTQVGFSEPIAALNIVLFALFAGLIMLRQGSLWMACGAHTGWNWFQGNVFGLPVSGNPPPDTVVFSVAPSPSAQHWLSGGTFGPEGSLVVMVLWGVSLVLAYRYFRAGPASTSAGSQAAVETDTASRPVA